MVVEFRSSNINHSVANRRGKVFTAYHRGTDEKISFHQVTEMFKTGGASNQAASELRKSLKEPGYKEVFLEFTPLNKEQYQNGAFSFVVLDASSPKDKLINRDVNQNAFTDKGNKKVFRNRDQDALLIIPEKVDKKHKFHSIADLANNGSLEQFKSFFTRTFLHVKSRANRPERQDEPFIVSTDGRGEAVLHMRIDEQPKYIKNKHYKRQFHELIAEFGAHQQQEYVDGQEYGGENSSGQHADVYDNVQLQHTSMNVESNSKPEAESMTYHNNSDSRSSQAAFEYLLQHSQPIGNQVKPVSSDKGAFRSSQAAFEYLLQHSQPIGNQGKPVSSNKGTSRGSQAAFEYLLQHGKPMNDKEPSSKADQNGLKPDASPEAAISNLNDISR